MSHATHPKPELSPHVRSYRPVVLAALLALIAMIAVLVVLAIADDQSTSSVFERPEQAVRADGGPEETAVAARIGAALRGGSAMRVTAGSQPAVARPDESAIAAAIGSPRAAAPTPLRPDESTVAASISGR